MDLIGYANIEVTRDTRRYTFSMPLGSPFTECHEVALQVANRIVELAQQEEARIAALKEQQDTVLPELANAELVETDSVSAEPAPEESVASDVSVVDSVSSADSVDLVDSVEPELLPNC